MSDDRKYSALRQMLLSPLQEHTIVPIDLSKLPEVQILFETLGLSDALNATVLPFNIKIKLGKMLDGITKDNKIPGDLDGNIPLIAYAISYGIVDKSGDPLFSEQDAVLISGKFGQLVILLAWEVLVINEFTTRAKQETVGNSVGTDTSENSSEQQAI
jgi:hypothetical protein